MTLEYEAGNNSPPANRINPARDSSFYTAMRVLPRQRRQAIMAIYAFCRDVDDIADDWSAEREKRLDALEGWRTQIDEIYQVKSKSHLHWLSDPIHEYQLSRRDFHDVIDGMIMDTMAPIRAPSLDTLDLYCDRVASAVGRLTSPIFGVPKKPGVELSHHLGRALQLTNILRDIDEDASMGRCYIPREMFTAAGIYGPIDPARIYNYDLTLACEPLVQITRDHFIAAHVIMNQRPRHETRAPRLMAKVYEDYLEALMHRGFAPPRIPIKKSKLRMLLAVIGTGSR